MGATIQRTRYSPKTKKILTDESSLLASNDKTQVISGIDVLSNNQVSNLQQLHHNFNDLSLEVNLLSSIITACLLGIIA